MYSSQNSHTPTNKDNHDERGLSGDLWEWGPWICGVGRCQALGRVVVREFGFSRLVIGLLASDEVFAPFGGSSPTRSSCLAKPMTLVSMQNACNARDPKWENYYSDYCLRKGL